MLIEFKLHNEVIDINNYPDVFISNNVITSNLKIYLNGIQVSINDLNKGLFKNLDLSRKVNGKNWVYHLLKDCPICQNTGKKKSCNCNCKCVFGFYKNN